MTDDSDLRINLNPPARKPAPDAPWDDDALQRQGIASELDALVSDLAGGAEAATIALDGGYGTGKTFILERWVQGMQDRGQIAVYYNAWENDCDDDPLVSLIETLASNDKTKWDRRTLAVVEEALTGISRRFTGVDLRKTSRAFKGETGGLLEAARGRRESRQKLKDILAELVKATRANKSSGVVVVIDELDRCRPTFANELMERVKHVMNVPGLVFVFGVNIVALRETVRVVYGDIDAHQYLLRFFAETLTMPQGAISPDPLQTGAADGYLCSLADRYGLRAFCNSHPLLLQYFGLTFDLLGIATASGGLTPRESEHVMRLISKAAASLTTEWTSPMIPSVLVPLAIARIKNPDAYFQTVSHPDEALSVINCFFDVVSEANVAEQDQPSLDRMEMAMYQVCHQPTPSNPSRIPPAHLALEEFARKSGTLTLEDWHLSRRLTGITKERAAELLERAPQERWIFRTLRYITSHFDLVWRRDQAP